MDQFLNEYKGLCPLCYMPVKSDEESRTLENGNRKESYHAHCLHEYVKQNTPEKTTLESPLLLILEQYKHLIINSNPEKRNEWIATQSQNWEYLGQYFKDMRELLGLSVKHVAKCLAVSPARIKRFESGQPVRDANLLCSAYNLLIMYSSAPLDRPELKALVEQRKTASESLVEPNGRGV